MEMEELQLLEDSLKELEKALEEYMKINQPLQLLDDSLKELEKSYDGYMGELDLLTQNYLSINE